MYTHTNMILAFPHESIQKILRITKLCAASSDKVREKRKQNTNLVQLLKVSIKVLYVFVFYTGIYNVFNSVHDTVHCWLEATNLIVSE